MWKCPGCPAIHQNPELHWKHLQENAKCMEKTRNPGWTGWQGVELDGIPTIIYKPADDLPRHLWGKPKSPAEQEEFRKLWEATLPPVKKVP